MPRAPLRNYAETRTDWYTASATTSSDWTALSSVVRHYTSAATSTSSCATWRMYAPTERTWSMAPWYVDSGTITHTENSITCVRQALVEWISGDSGTTNGLWPVAKAWTPEELAAQEARRQALDTARARAEELLRRHLTEDQRRTLIEHGWFVVVSKSGKRYRITRGRSHNIKLLDAQDRPVRSYCAVPSMVVPEGDVMLSQKLMLELAEDRFLAIANTYPIQRRDNEPARTLVAAMAG